MFSKIKFKSQKINYLSGFTFSIYIIHFNSFIIQVLYRDLLKCEDFYFSSWFFIHFILSIICIYLVSIVLELVRRYLMKLLVIILDKAIEKINYDKLVNKNNQYAILSYE